MACDICGKTHCELHQLAEWLAGGPFSHVCTTCLSGDGAGNMLTPAEAVQQLSFFKFGQGAVASASM